MQFRIGLIAFCLATTTANAQGGQSPIQQGSIQIGGTADISHTEPEGNGPGLTIIEAFPRVGYFVVKGLALSANVRYRRASAEDQTNVKDQTSTEWGLGPGVSYYVATPVPRLFPFVSGRLLYNRTSSHSEQLPSGAEIDSRIRTKVWLVSGGALYMLGEHVGLTSEAFHQWNRNKITSGSGAAAKSNSTTYGIQWGITAFIF